MKKTTIGKSLTTRTVTKECRREARNAADECAVKAAAKAVPVMIGDEEIYPQQIKIAEQVMWVLEQNRRAKTLHKRSPIVGLQPQSGKTGVIIAIIKRFILSCIRRKKTFQVLVLCGLSDKTLMEQTYRRLRTWRDGLKNSGAGLIEEAQGSGLTIYPNAFDTPGIIVLNNTRKLKGLDLKADGVRVDERLVITDEVHIGLNKGGSLETLYLNHGIRINEQIHQWGDGTGTLNHWVGVSATPFPQILKAEETRLTGETLFTMFYEDPPANYNGIERMLKSKRLRKTERLFAKDGSISPFFTARWKEFLIEAHPTRQGPGYLVVRTIGEVHTHMMAYIGRQNRIGNKIEVVVFDSSANPDPRYRPIKDLVPTLSKKPACPILVLIKGAMRAGITLGQKHYILGWIEPETEGVDTQIQAGVGRACGYGARLDDTYPIYCDLDAINEMIMFYDDLRKRCVQNVPAGRHSRKLEPSRVYPPIAIVTKEIGEAYQKEARLRDKEHNVLRKSHPDLEHRNSGQISSTSHTIVNNIAYLAYEGHRDSHSALGYRIDGEVREDVWKAYQTNGKRAEVKTREHFLNCRASYKLLLKKYPQLRTEDKIILMDVPDYQKVFLPLLEKHPEWQKDIIWLTSAPSSVLVGHRDDYQKKSSSLLSKELN